MAVNSTDPIQWARDSCGDVIIPFRRASGLEAVESLVRAALLLYIQEWFLDLSKGVKWLPTTDGVVPERDAILGQPYNSGKIRAELRRVILQVTGVGTVTSVKTTFDPTERALSVDAAVRTRFGDLTVSTAVPA